MHVVSVLFDARGVAEDIKQNDLKKKHFKWLKNAMDRWDIGFVWRARAVLGAPWDKKHMPLRGRATLKEGGDLFASRLEGKSTNRR